MSDLRRAIGVCLALLPFSAPSSGEGPGLGPGPIYHAVLNGDFAVTGWSLSSARGTAQGPGAAVTLAVDIPASASVLT